MEQVRHCNCCGGNNFALRFQQPDFLYFNEEIFSVTECLDCGLGFVNPRPDISEIGRFYPRTFFDYFSKINHTKRYEEEARYLKKFLGNSIMHGKILDIGCANGDFPRFLQKKFGSDILGLEVSENATTIRDFPCYRLPFPEAPIPKESLDAITAWAVLEHVHDPMAYFRKAAVSLKPGGYFIFLVNNFKSLASRHLYCEDIPRHLFFFSKPTIKLYAHKNGFTVEDIRFNNKIYSTDSRYWFFWLLKRIRRDYFDYKYIIKLNKMKFDKEKNPGLLAKINHAIRHPVHTTDYILLPMVDRLMMLLGRYGVMTCALKKRP